MLEFRCILEELRVSFFAQELRTPPPVSLKRLEKAWGSWGRFFGDMRMRWIAIFDDTPEMLVVRREREHLHLSYLRDHADEILIAGGCRNEPETPFIGGLWILEVASRARAVTLIENDPYFVPSFRNYKLRTWGKAFPDLKITL